MIVIYWRVLKLTAAPGTERRFYINQLSKTISADARLVHQRQLSIAYMAAGREYQLKKTLSYPGNTALNFVSALIVNHATGIVCCILWSGDCSGYYNTFSADWKTLPSQRFIETPAPPSR